jgi:hypothetical protein
MITIMLVRFLAFGTFILGVMFTDDMKSWLPHASKLDIYALAIWMWVVTIPAELRDLRKPNK